MENSNGVFYEINNAGKVRLLAVFSTANLRKMEQTNGQDFREIAEDSEIFLQIVVLNLKLENLVNLLNSATNINIFPKLG